MSELAAALPSYAASGELNTSVADPAAITAEVAKAFEGRGEISWTDGLLASGPDWWLSVRESNTETVAAAERRGSRPGPGRPAAR